MYFLKRAEPKRNLNVMLTCQFVEVLGGAEKQCASLSAALQAAGEKVVVLTSRVPGHPVSRHGELRVVRFWSPVPPQAAGRYLPASLIWAIQVFIWLFWHRRSISIIHVHQLRINAYVAAFAQKILGIPTVMKLGTGGPLNDLKVIGHRKYVLGGAGARFVVRHVNRFVATTSEIKDDLTAFGVLPQSIASIPNGVDLSHYSVGLEASRSNRADGMKSEIVTSYVGRLSSEKNVVAMLEAIGLVRAPRKASVLIAGDGPLRDLADSLVQRDPLLANVEFLGQVQDVAAVLHRTHFLMLVSQREGLSNALLEALAAGVVPILTVTSGTRDVIPFDDYPLFVSDTSCEAIASAIQLAYGMQSDEWEYWSERLSSHVHDKFDLRQIALQYINLYRVLKTSTTLAGLRNRARC